MTSEEDCFVCHTNTKDKATSPDNLAVAVPFRDPCFPGHVVVAPAAHRDVEDTLKRPDGIAVPQVGHACRMNEYLLAEGLLSIAENIVREQPPPLYFH